MEFKGAYSTADTGVGTDLDGVNLAAFNGIVCFKRR